MNLSVIKKEIKSEALKEVVSSLTKTVNNVKERKIDFQQAQMEIAGCKHIIQTIALDWAFGGRLKVIESEDIK